MHTPTLLPWLLVLLALLPTGLMAADRPVFRAGAHAENINPLKYPVSVNGGFSDRQARAAVDPLHARCLVLDDGKTRLALCVVDSCMVPREIVEEAKRLTTKATGIPASHILISATHTHTAPTLTPVFQSRPDKSYVETLPARIAAGIEKAYKNLEPAQIGWGWADNPRQVFNRRWFRQRDLIPRDPFGGTTDQVQMNPGYQAKGLVKPAGPVDPRVSILAVRSAAGRPIALYANYSLHYVGGVEPLSADYFGAFADRISGLLGSADQKPAFVAALSNGASGDVNNINFGSSAPGPRKPGEQMRLVAHDVANTAMEAYKKMTFRDWVSLDAACEDLQLGVRRPTEKDLARAREILARVKGRELRGAEEVYAGETVGLASYPSTVPVALQALRIGELGICAIPCEVFAEIGLELRSRSPLKDTFTVSLANGYNGYLPTPQQHKLGGYETWRARSSYLEVNASTHIVAKLLELLQQVQKTR